MRPIITKRAGRTVSEDGAPAGAVLRGFVKTNEGLRIRISQPQDRGALGAVQGDFVIVDVGKNSHSDALRPLLNQVTNSTDVATLIRRNNSARINVANVNILFCETPDTPAPAGDALLTSQTAEATS